MVAIVIFVNGTDSKLTQRDIGCLNDDVQIVQQRPIPIPNDVTSTQSTHRKETAETVIGLELGAADECPTDRQLIGVIEISTDREAGGETGYPYP